MRRYLPFLFIFVVWFFFAHPFFFQGKVPYPSTYQVNNYAPWSQYERFWGPVKNGAMPDIITQIYPWRYFTIDSWGKGQIPLWNPYSFSGTPHLANYQSAVLAPLNILFLLPLSFIDVWSILILLQPLLAGIFMYLFIRSLGVSSIGSLISSISFMFCGFITTWMGYGTLPLSISLLPLALFAIEKFFQSQRLRYLLVLAVLISFSFFSGHFQTSLYFLMFILGYIIFKSSSILLQTSPSRSLSSHLEGVASRLLPGGYLLLSTIFGLLLAMPQILPSIEFYTQSVRSELFSKGEVIPWVYLPTLLAPDFFGNPVTRNDWFGHYAEWNAYAGVLPLLLSIYLILRRRVRPTIFFMVTGIVSLLLAFDTPLLDLLFKLQIPVLATSAASRIIVLFSFSVAVLSGFGLDQLLQDINKRNIKKIALWLSICFVMFAVLWTIVIFKLFVPIDKIAIARSNLILPTVIFLTGGSIILFLISTRKSKFILLNSLFMILVISFDMLRFAIKWVPFDPKDQVFAEVSVIKFFKQIAGSDRALGNYEAGIAAYYQLPSLEGYDPLYIGRYGEFVASLTDGKVRQSYRSVVSFPRDGLHTARAVDFLGIKYIVHKKGDDGVGWTLPYWKYASGQFQLIFEDAKYRIFENKNAFPRAFLVGKYSTISNKQQIIDAMFEKDFDLREEVVLEEDLKLGPKDLKQANAKITGYTPNVINIETQADQDALLILTDNFYPGWKGFVDGKNVPILRADYTFRSIVVPEGSHKVKFVYEPRSFQFGLYAALTGIIGIVLLSLSRGADTRTPRG